MFPEMIREEYHVESGRRTCRQCQRQFLPTEEYVSGLVEVEPDEEHPHGLSRLDYCVEHWPAEGHEWLAFWKTRVPEPEEPVRKRVRIDDNRLLDVFFRLAETEDPLKLDLRYVVGLMLIRRRRLKLQGSVRRGGQSFMRVRKSRSRELFDLMDRHLSDEAVAAVGSEIGTLLDLAESVEPEEPSDET